MSAPGCLHFDSRDRTGITKANRSLEQAGNVRHCLNALWIYRQFPVSVILLKVELWCHSWCDSARLFWNILRFIRLLQSCDIKLYRWLGACRLTDLIIIYRDFNGLCITLDVSGIDVLFLCMVITWIWVLIEFRLLPRLACCFMRMINWAFTGFGAWFYLMLAYSASIFL